MIEEVKPPTQSVTAYVRSAVLKAVERHRLQAAAVAYRAFVQEHPEEREWLGEWEGADLGSPPPAKRQKR